MKRYLPRIFQAGRDYFTERPGITGEQLFNYIKAVGQDYGWDFGGVIAGHLVGEFPHEKIAGDEIESYIAAGSRQPKRRKDRAGKTCHWILEVHLVDRQRRLGGFHEELLDLPRACIRVAATGHTTKNRLREAVSPSTAWAL